MEGWKEGRMEEKQKIDLGNILTFFVQPLVLGLDSY